MITIVKQYCCPLCLLCFSPAVRVAGCKQPLRVILALCTVDRDPPFLKMFDMPGGPLLECTHSALPVLSMLSL